MQQLKRRLKALLQSNYKKDADRYSFFDTGFHGDTYLLELVDFLIKQCDHFVETGTNVGSTLAYVARNYPQLTCLSCEPDVEAYRRALSHTQDLSNVTLVNALSQDFLRWLQETYAEFPTWRTLFWLDAHGYGFKWPLKEELEFITGAFKQGYILIDDFKVPGREQYSFDQYMDQICSYEFVQDALSPDIPIQLYYPNYEKRTSPYHPLVGWGLIGFGAASNIVLPQNIIDFMEEGIH